MRLRNLPGLPTFWPSLERNKLPSPRLSDRSELDIDIGARTDFGWKGQDIGQENDGRRLDGIGVSLSGALCEPPGESLESGRETCWIGIPLGGSPFTGLFSGWCGDEAIISEELSVSFAGCNIPVTCFVNVAIAR